MARRETRFKSVEEWIAFCRTLTLQDQDDVILLAGEPGNGKSTLAVQLARALDPTITLDRITFGVQEFLTAARSTPQHCAVLADELLANRRKSMSKDNKDLIDFLQVCRGLNLHLLICFPHAAMLDAAVLSQRVRWRIDITLPDGPMGPRVASVTERRVRTLHDTKGEETYAVHWVPVLQFRFARNRGPFWEEYLAKKLSAARQRNDVSRGPTLDVPEPAPIRRSRPRRYPGTDPGGTVLNFRVRPTSPLASTFPHAVHDPSQDGS